jgi:hypothetical protein
MARRLTHQAVRRLGPAAAIIGITGLLAGCGSSTTVETVAARVVTVVVTSPTSGSVIASNSVVVRGTVTPANATVQVAGQPAVVGNGVFEGTAALHSGKTTIDVIGSASGDAPGSTSVEVVQPSQGSGSSGSASSHHHSGATPGVAHESAGTAGGYGETSCGGGLAVGPDTTCVFAEAVEEAYRSSGEASVVEAYSPVTHKNYEMTCVADAGEVACTGGIGAAVYFPQ